MTTNYSKTYAAACYRPFQVTFDVIKRLKNAEVSFAEDELNELYLICDAFKKRIGIFMRTYAAISNVLIQPVRHYGVIWRPTIEKQRIIDFQGNV